VACKGIPILIGAVGRHTKAEELLESAVCVLCNLTRGNDSNKEAILKANGAQSIVDTVLNNFQSLELLLTCFRTIGNLAYNVKSISEVIRVGAVQGIVAGMTVHSEEEDVTDVALKVLNNLAVEFNEDNYRILAQEGAVQAVVEVANNFIKNADIEIGALTCLSNLARYPDNAKMMILQGAYKSVHKACKAFNYENQLSEAGMRLLSQLATCSQEVDRMIENKAVSCIVQTLKANSHDKVTIGFGLQAVILMAYGGDAAFKIAEEGPIDLCVQLMSDNQQELDIQTDSLTTMSALTRSEKNADNMADAAFRSLVQGYRNHGANVRWLQAAYIFIGNCCVVPAAAEKVVDTGIIGQTLRSLAKCLVEPGVLLKGLRALENTAYSSDRVRDHMKKEGVEGGVMAISDASGGRDDVKRGCKQVIDALNHKTLALGSGLTTIAKPTMPVRKLFDEDEKKIVKELSQEVKNFLTAGQLLMKHSNNANPRARHVYVTPDLKFLVWKDPKKPQLDDKCRMKVHKLRSIDKGRCTKQLQRKTLTGKYLAKEECAFAVLGKDRTVDLEAKSETERNKWCENLQILQDWRKAQKAINTKFESR
jgi:hypothetical protein